MNNANNFFNNDHILNLKKKNGPSVALVVGGFLFVIVIILMVVWYMRSSTEEQDCELSDWSSWENCKSVDSCPSGKNRIRTRTVLKEPSKNGKACGDMKDYKNQCELSDWSSWRACDDGECEIGKNEIRNREVQDGICEGKSLVDYRYELPTSVDCIDRKSVV